MSTVTAPDPTAGATGGALGEAVGHARTLVAACRAVVDGATARLAADSAKNGRVDVELMDREQVLAYDLATVAGRVTAAEALLGGGVGDGGSDAYAARGDLEARLAVLFAGDVARDLTDRTIGREADWAIGPDSPWRSADTAAALVACRAVGLLEDVADTVLKRPELPRHLPEDLELARTTFRDFAEERVRPQAEAVHREDRDLPESIITELGEMGCFGLSIPESYGGHAEGASESDLMSMVVVTEELSRGSLGIAGSLITRPEILSKALLKGGTDAQKAEWLPRIAAGEKMCAVAVTEPDYGSDVASLAVTARRQDGAAGDAADTDADYVVNGTKTWCTFAGRADYLMLLARTGAPEDRHKGLSLFVVEKPPYPGHAFTHEDGRGGKMTARAIGTLGYRGMHSFEITFEDYHVPAANLVGGEAGLGRGFYLQMDAFANGRLQTAARALGVMQAAFEDAVAYANERHVFGVPLAAYQLTRAKLARMAAQVAAGRWFTYRAARLLAQGHAAGDATGQLEASMVKSMTCAAAEWVTREAQQVHGGMGYAEEYDVSRYFVDARVLSVFEGADETLALRVIIRRMLEDALAGR